MRRASLLARAAALLVVIAAGLVVLWARAPAAPSFEVRDAVSKSWVWDSTIRLENRVIRGFYSTSYRFTHLHPGTFDLTVSAPHYEPARVRVRVGFGRSTFTAPIYLVGYEIPDFSRFAVAANRGARGLELELAPADKGGHLIKVFPCMDLRIAVRVSVQLKGGAPAIAPVEEGAARGARIFEGKVGWTWNPAIDAVYRYTAAVAGIPPDAGPYVVIDYVVIIPDPRKISAQEVGALVDGLVRINDVRALAVFLEPYRDRVRVESGSLWNVRW